MSKHTPTPYHVSTMSAKLSVIVDSSGSEICSVYRGQYYTGDTRTDAAFIVKACNMHEDLVKFLEFVAVSNPNNFEALKELALLNLMKCEAK